MSFQEARSDKRLVKTGRVVERGGFLIASTNVTLSG